MKWAILRKDIPSGIKEKDKKNSYIVYKKIKEKIDKNGEKRCDGERVDEPVTDCFNEWVTHPIDMRFGRRAKHDYEIFCGGFLYFYDNHVNEKVDHILHFDWSKKPDKKGKFTVTIFISPPAVRNYADSYIIYKYVPPPAGTTDPPNPPPPPPPPGGRS